MQIPLSLSCTFQPHVSINLLVILKNQLTVQFCGKIFFNMNKAGYKKSKNKVKQAIQQVDLSDMQACILKSKGRAAFNK